VLVNVSQDAGHFLRPVKTREGSVGSGSDSKPGSNFAFCKPACQWCESESGFRMEIPGKRPSFSGRIARLSDQDHRGLVERVVKLCALASYVA
jgi:hypothetical protein